MGLRQILLGRHGPFDQERYKEATPRGVEATTGAGGGEGAVSGTRGGAWVTAGERGCSSFRLLSFSPEAELHPHACLGPCDTSHRAQDLTCPDPPHSLSGKGSQPPLARPRRFQAANKPSPTHSREGSPVLQLPLGLQSLAALHQPPEKRVTGVGGTQSPLSSGCDLGSCVLVAA